VSYNRFRSLGAFVYSGVNLGDDQLNAFSAAGGRWFAPVIYGDDAAGPWNVANLEQLKSRARPRNLEVAGWFNVTGGDNEKYASDIAAMAKKHGLPLVILDAELAYQYPAPGCSMMPDLLKRIRSKLPTTDLLLSSLGPNDSYIYNGRTLAPAQSMYDLGWRHAPQWYSSYYGRDGNTAPAARMKWLKEQGPNSMNVRDSNAPKSGYRGLPLSYVHPTVEATNLEGSDLKTELNDLTTARSYGLTNGFSYYYLEHREAPDDMKLLAAVRGKLFDG
jgi:hypothetical protein